MSRTKRYIPFILGVASVSGIAALLVRQRRGEINNLYIWRQVLIKHHGVKVFWEPVIRRAKAGKIEVQP